VRRGRSGRRALRPADRAHGRQADAWHRPFGSACSNLIELIREHDRRSAPFLTDVYVLHQGAPPRSALFLLAEALREGSPASVHRDMPLRPGLRRTAVSDFMTPRAAPCDPPALVSLEEAETGHVRAPGGEAAPRGRMRDASGGLVTMRDLKLYKQKPHSTKGREGPSCGWGRRWGRPATTASGRRPLVEQEVDVLLLDVAHADSDVVAPRSRELADGGRLHSLVVGNVATAEGARRLVDLGVDAIKVGVGPAGLRTRLETGAGVPSSRAVRETYLAPGGRCRSSPTAGCATTRTLFLAVACGASTVMLGSMLSGGRTRPGLGRGGPGHAPEDEAYGRPPRRRWRRERTTSWPRPCAPRPRGSRSGALPWGASSASSPASRPPAVGGQLRRGGEPARRPRERSPATGPLPSSRFGASRRESFVS